MDKHREELVENYEDALFTLLMDDYAQAEGERLLQENEKLCNDPNFSLPEGMEERGLAAIRKEFRKRRMKSIARTGKKVLSRVAMVVLILNILFFVPFFTVDAFYVNVMNIVLDYQDAYTTVQFVGDDLKLQEDATGISIEQVLAALPSGYAIQEYTGDADTSCVFATFTSEGSDPVYWQVRPLGKSTFNLDTEDADYTAEIEIAGYEGIVVEKDGISTVLWGDTIVQEQYMINAETGWSELVKLVETIVSTK